MALDDLLAKFDRMLASPLCQKAVGTTKYSAMRDSIGEKIKHYKNEPITPRAAQKPPPWSPSFPRYLSSSTALLRTREG